MAADAWLYMSRTCRVSRSSPMDASLMLTDVFPPPLVAQPSALFPPLLQSDPLFMVKAEQPDDLVSPMQLLPEDPALAYMNVPMESSPMEAVEASVSLDSLLYPPDIASGAPSFALAPPTDTLMSLEITPTTLSTPSPPLPVLAASQPLAVSGLSLELSSASIQAPSPPFSVVPSSLEAALIPTASFTSPQRASSSVSPVPISNASSQSPAPYSTSASQSPTATTAASQPAMALPPAEAENILIKDEVPIAKQKKEVANLLNA
ncbi:hypothetical protein EST38_g8524 [Candolleomyces aberdarensis]|uniref:Uncharacterized protein n=1 Tax=Candolleomyces aberdarensis TaxID=2316362 RepID=A0A4Q2DC97_9AGAR|nr:hypothetical protein EST38_g8524 [Candolleomyces aberdarensis]